MSDVVDEEVRMPCYGSPMLNRFALSLMGIAAPLVLAAGCGSSREPAKGTEHAGSGSAIGNPEPVAPAVPPADAAAAPVAAAAPSTAKLAAIRTKDDHVSLDVFSFASGKLEQASTTELPLKEIYHATLLWTAADRPAIVAAYTAAGNDLWFGAVQAGKVTPLSTAKKVAGSVEWSMVAERDGAAWLRHCAKPQISDEQCGGWGYSRVWPSPKTATKIEAAQPEAEAATPSSSVKLTPRETAPGSGYYVLDCERGGATTTLFAKDQHVAAAKLTWLSAEPPIALAHTWGAGMGDETGPNGMSLIRGCVAEDVASVTTGPDGLWAQSSGDKLTIFRGASMLGTIEASAIAFAH